MITNQSVPPHFSPKIRAYGKARLDIARRAAAGEDWEKLWKPPLHPFPFSWGERWKYCVEYKVDDFAAEVGFFIDVLGFLPMALDPQYAMFTDPEENFTFAVTPTPEGDESTPSEAIRLQFMVADIFEAADELERRGVVIESHPEPLSEGSSLFISCFRTPHGIPLELWSEVELPEEGEASLEKEAIEKEAIEKEAIEKEAIEEIRPPNVAREPAAQVATPAGIPARGKGDSAIEEQLPEVKKNAGQRTKYEVTYEDADEAEPYEDEDENPWKKKGE